MAGLVELLAGAALGTLTSELYTRVENLIKNYKQFNPVLNNIKATLDSLSPLIQQMEDKNKQLNLSTDETEKFRNKISDGLQLLDECSHDPKWHKKVTYTKRLKDLDDALKRQLGILTAQGVRDGKETLGLARKLNDQLAEQVTDAKQIGNQVTEIVRVVEQLMQEWKTVVVDVLVLYVTFNLRAVIEEVDQYQGIFGPDLLLLPDHGERTLLSRCMLFLARAGILVGLIVAKTVKYTSCIPIIAVCYGLACFLGEIIRDEFRQGFSWSGLRKSLSCIGFVAYAYYCCFLLVTAGKCDCSPSQSNKM